MGFFYVVHDNTLTLTDLTRFYFEAHYDETVCKKENGFVKGKVVLLNSEKVILPSGCKVNVFSTSFKLHTQRRIIRKPQIMNERFVQSINHIQNRVWHFLILHNIRYTSWME